MGAGRLPPFSLRAEGRASPRRRRAAPGASAPLLAGAGQGRQNNGGKAGRGRVALGERDSLLQRERIGPSPYLYLSYRGTALAYPFPARCMCYPVYGVCATRTGPSRGTLFRQRPQEMRRLSFLVRAHSFRHSPLQQRSKGGNKGQRSLPICIYIVRAQFFPLGRLSHPCAPLLPPRPAGPWRGRDGPPRPPSRAWQWHRLAPRSRR